MKKKKIENRDVEFLFRDFGVCFLLYTYMEKIQVLFVFFQIFKQFGKKKRKEKGKGNNAKRALTNSVLLGTSFYNGVWYYIYWKFACNSLLLNCRTLEFSSSKAFCQV